MSGWVGVVEGFYGRPWDRAERRAVIDVLAETSLRTYVLAPKNAPKHREGWAHPYDAEELQEIGQLHRMCQAHGIDFVLGLSPIATVRQSLERPTKGALKRSVIDRVLDKLTPAREAGVERFALLFDDTPATFVQAAASDDLGRAHARIADGIFAGLGLEGSEALLVVPAVYFGRAARLGAGGRAYLSALSRMRSEIAIAWTGPNVFSPRVTADDAVRMADLLGRRPVLWNNEIANDWLPLLTGLGPGRTMQKLTLFPVENVEPSAVFAMGGVLLNGAHQAGITSVALRTLADLVREPQRYVPSESLVRALGGEGSRGIDALTRLLPLLSPRLDRPLLGDEPTPVQAMQWLTRLEAEGLPPIIEREIQGALTYLRWSLARRARSQQARRSALRGELAPVWSLVRASIFERGPEPWWVRAPAAR